MARARFRTALGWAFVLNWGRQGGVALITFVLASVLGPETFGTVALAQVYLLFVEMFQEQGLSKALIQRGDLDDLLLDTVFWTNLALSGVLWAGSLAAAPFYARMSESPDLPAVIMALSLGVPINALTIVQQAVLQRALDFRSLALRANASVWAGGAVGVGMAFAGFGVWALVGQSLATAILSLALLWSLSRWRPRLRFDRGALRELLDFSFGALLARLAQFANRRGEVLVIGYLLSPTAVGLYRLAQRLMDLPLELSTRSVQAVSLPAFARLQEDPPALRRRVEQGVWIASTLAAPALFVMSALAGKVLAAVGPEWADATLTLQILCFAGAGRAAVVQIGPLLQAVGRPMYLAGLTAGIAAVTLGASVGVIAWLGEASTSQQIAGIAASRAAVVLLVNVPLFLSIILSTTGIPLKRLLPVFGPGIASGLAAFAAAALAEALLPLAGEAPLVRLGAHALLVGGAAGATLLATDARVRSSLASLRQRLLVGKSERLPRELL